MPTLRMSGGTPLLPVYALMAWTGRIYLFSDAYQYLRLGPVSLDCKKTSEWLIREYVEGNRHGLVDILLSRHLCENGEKYLSSW